MEISNKVLKKQIKIGNIKSCQRRKIIIEEQRRGWEYIRCDILEDFSRILYFIREV